MSAKNDKKLRQHARRMLRSEIERQAAARVDHWNQVIKPKPAWMPLFIYRLCLKVVLK